MWPWIGITQADSNIQAIQYELATRKNLTLDQTFVKTEATDTDVIVILRTLWERGSHIPCSASDRLAFQCAILLSAICGARPNEIMQMPYRCVKLAVVRDPKNKKDTKLIVTFLHRHSKGRKHLARGSQDDR
jgi:hypothetical protein